MNNITSVRDEKEGQLSYQGGGGGEGLPEEKNDKGNKSMSDLYPQIPPSIDLSVVLPLLGNLPVKKKILLLV